MGVNLPKFTSVMRGGSCDFLSCDKKLLLKHSNILFYIKVFFVCFYI